MARCFVCPPGQQQYPEAEILDHLRVIHPDVWGDGLKRWPDGRIVVFDETLTPGDFGGERP
jgi:hypothetical protein